MIFKWVNSKGEGKDIFDINPELKNVKEFYGSVQKKIEQLTDKEMRFVMLVADTQSPCKLLSPENRRASAVLLLGLTNDDDEPNELGKQLILGRKANVENAIKFFRKHFAPRSEVMKQEAVETLNKAWITQRKILEYAHENKLFDKDSMIEELSNNDVKILTEGNKIIKEGLQQKLLESLRIFEDELNCNEIPMTPENQVAIDGFSNNDSKGKFSFDRIELKKKK